MVWGKKWWGAIMLPAIKTRSRYTFSDSCKKHTHTHRKNFNAVNLKIQCNIKSLDKSPKIVWNIFQIHYRNTYLKFKNWLLTRGRTVGRVYCSQTNQKSEKTTTPSKMSVTPSKRPNNQWTFLHNRQTERLTDGRADGQTVTQTEILTGQMEGRTYGRTDTQNKNA